MNWRNQGDYKEGDCIGRVFSRGSRHPHYFLCIGGGRFISAKEGEWREQRINSLNNLTKEVGLPMEWVAKQWGVGAKEAACILRSHLELPAVRASTKVKYDRDRNNETRKEMSGLWEYEMTMRAFNRRHRYREVAYDFSRENHPLCKTDAFVSDGKIKDEQGTR